MKAEITFSQLWWNHSLLNFFFRSQSEKTLNELMERRASGYAEDVCEVIEDYADSNGYDLDDIEEMFYSFGDGSVEELAEEFGIALKEQ